MPTRCGTAGSTARCCPPIRSSRFPLALLGIILAGLMLASVFVGVLGALLMLIPLLKGIHD